MSFAVSISQDVGAGTLRDPVTVDATGVTITLTGDNRRIEFQNTGTKIIYYGGSNTTSTNGFKLYPNDFLRFAGVTLGWSMKFICGAAESSELRISEANP